MDNENTEVLLPSKTITTADLEGIDSNLDGESKIETVYSITIGKIIKYIAVIFILSLMGINIFIYLGIFTEKTIILIKELFGFLIYPFGETIKQTSNVSTTGIKKSVDLANEGVNQGVNALKKKKTKNNDYYEIEEDLLNNSNSNKKERKRTKTQGYCYIGNDNGRNCVKVNRNDVCMSGDIFPSIDICINPNLRS